MEGHSLSSFNQPSAIKNTPPNSYALLAFDDERIDSAVSDIDLRRTHNNHKNLLDFFVFCLVLFVILPLMLLIFCLIKMDGGHVIYKLRRIGCNGDEFFCLKFRTMSSDVDKALRDLLASDERARFEWEAGRKLFHDCRVTWLGRLLRATLLDKLPQLFNVLCGDMSLVGPRPVPRLELEKYYGTNARYYLMVRPGLTRAWQVNGRSNLS